MSWEKEVDEIERRKAFAKQLGGEAAIAKQHAQGKYTVRERIDLLLDDGTFREIGALSGKATYDENHELTAVRPANAVIGTGLIEGRKVSIDGDDWTIRGGSSEATVSEKWIYAETYALEMQIPLIRLVESAGGSVRLLEQMVSTKIPGYPTWLPSKMLGVIPVVGLALGPCAGLGALKAACAHFTVMVKGTSQVFAGGPPVVHRGMGVEVDKETLGGSAVHVRQSGVMGNEAASEEEAFEMTRRFLSYLPSNVYEMPPVIACEDPKDRREEELLSIIPREKRRVYRSRKILDLVMDKGSVFELRQHYGRSVVTSFARLGGRPVGVIINDPMHYGGGMTLAAAKKMEQFIDLCDTFHLPVINFVDQPGTIVGPEAEREGAVAGSMRVAMALEQTQIPWCTVVIRRLYGLAGSAYGRFQGLNYHVSWPSGRWGSIPISGGVEAAYASELEALNEDERKARIAELEAYFEHLESPFLTAERFRIPDVIDPRETRALLNDWLDDAWRILPQQLGVKARTMRI